MSNLQVSYEAIMDACSTAAIPFSCADIDKMLLNKKPMSNRVKRIITSLIKGEPIESIKYVEPPKVLIPTKNYIERKGEAIEIIRGNYFKRLDISCKMNLSNSQMDRLLAKMKADGTIRYAIHPTGHKVWFLSDMPNPDFGEEARNATDRAEAKEKGLMHFNGKECIKCNTTIRYVKCGQCLKCKLNYHKEYNQDYKRTDR